MSELKHVDDDGDLNVFVVGAKLLVTCGKSDGAWVADLMPVQEASKDIRESIADAARSGSLRFVDSDALVNMLGD